MTTYTGERNPNWKGGRTVASNGYVLVRRTGHPLADVRGYVYEHRLVAYELLGRPLQRDERVHHINGDRTDNRPENVEVVSTAGHAARHRTRDDLRWPGQPNETVACECGCGATFDRFDSTGRPRRYVSGHNLRSA